MLPLKMFRDIQVVEATTKIIVIIIEFFHSKVNVTLPFGIHADIISKDVMW